jgi:hypothetical protein
MERSVSESPSSPWHAAVEAFVRTSPVTAGVGATTLGRSSRRSTSSLAWGALTFAANVFGPISRAIGDGVAYRVKRRLEGSPPPAAPNQ